ncbi:DUF427 domain-containing protein [Pseudobacteriovorax antillogorgiicola]|uniref:Uncharacterized conserved protein, DUF427 family n=1 Tax=Pseudobacteriovorax antillogorgiicola TaxID=1513793 RepID=A0A1Y6CDR0_9BACT|nr:DUF427 domain-containing protein [Pseudobacteriovorax antillogorgiicola]TCS49363.1 uncharacterized protein (DUF427 family) [Pseudobacteriovorax antillogorgiicola]SMF47508.1 Uncharacterized conserved protein, DUF427 family [Pseudobacteriovorax antillogorgiicola]
MKNLVARTVRAYLGHRCLADSTETVKLGGQVYFPPGDVAMRFFTEKHQEHLCIWKGMSHYFDVVIDGESYPELAWKYIETKHEAKQIQDLICFSSKVKVRAGWRWLGRSKLSRR